MKDPNPTGATHRDSHPNQTIIRPAVPYDAARIVAGIEAICAEDIFFVTDRFLPDEQWEAVLHRPETAPDHLLVVAEVGGVFAGCGNLFSGPPGRKDRHVAHLGMYVLKPFRDRGVGTGMMAWMLEWAERMGLKKITLSVLATNQPAIHLYHKFGFEVEGVRRWQYLVAGHYVDSLLMAKFLNKLNDEHLLAD
jgi:RimJ/RimL family protein N-acetyltransferase